MLVVGSVYVLFFSLGFKKAQADAWCGWGTTPAGCAKALAQCLAGGYTQLGLSLYGIGDSRLMCAGDRSNLASSCPAGQGLIAGICMNPTTNTIKNSCSFSSGVAKTTKCAGNSLGSKKTKAFIDKENQVI